MTHRPPTLDMRLDGTFRTPPRTGVPFSFKLMMGGIAIAAIAGAVAFAALAVWVLSMALPVLIVAGFVAWCAMRFRRWQVSRASTPRAVD